MRPSLGLRSGDATVQPCLAERRPHCHSWTRGNGPDIPSRAACDGKMLLTLKEFQSHQQVNSLARPHFCSLRKKKKRNSFVHCNCATWPFSFFFFFLMSLTTQTRFMWWVDRLVPLSDGIKQTLYFLFVCLTRASFPRNKALKRKKKKMLFLLFTVISADSSFLYPILSRVTPSALWVNNPEMSPRPSRTMRHSVSSDWLCDEGQTWTKTTTQ